MVVNHKAMDKKVRTTVSWPYVEETIERYEREYQKQHIGNVRNR